MRRTLPDHDDGKQDSPPTGFAAVPNDLFGRGSPAHLSTFAAIASAIDFRTRSGAVRGRRIDERAHVSERTRRRVISDLAAWGFLEVETRAGGSSVYRLRLGDFTAVPNALRTRDGCTPAHVALAAALNFHDVPVTTGDIEEWAGVSKPTRLRVVADLVEWGFVEVEERPGEASLYRVQDVPTRSTGDRGTRSTHDRGNRETRSTDAGTPGQLVAGGRSTGDRTPQNHSPESLSEHACALPDLNHICAEEEVARWKVRHDHAEAALIETDHRIKQGEPIDKPASYARAIADCYRGQCRNPGQHDGPCGEEAIARHRSLREQAAELEALADRVDEARAIIAACPECDDNGRIIGERPDGSLWAEDCPAHAEPVAVVRSEPTPLRSRDRRAVKRAEISRQAEAVIAGCGSCGGTRLVDGDACPACSPELEELGEEWIRWHPPGGHHFARPGWMFPPLLIVGDIP